MLLLVARAAASAAPTHLERTFVIDAVHVDEQTGQVSFALLLDWPLDQEGTHQAAELKLNRYYRARRQGLHVRRFPGANPALPVKLHVFHLPARSARSRDVLSQIERSARRYGFLPTFESRSGIEGPAAGSS